MCWYATEFAGVITKNVVSMNGKQLSSKQLNTDKPQLHSMGGHSLIVEEQVGSAEATE